MAKFRLLITDLTEYGQLRCIAGWDLERGKMIRPEPHPGGFWQATLCGPGKPFAPGNIVSFEGAAPVPKTEYPHLNEDIVVQGAASLDKVLSADKFIEALRQVETVDRSVAFAAPVEIDNAKAFIRTGTKCPSLRGLKIKGDAVLFIEEKYGDKPPKARCLISIPQKASINLAEVEGKHSPVN